MVNNVTTLAKPLLKKLIAKQGHLSDRQFAGELGIVRPLWSLARSGKRPISLTLLKAIALTYPDMHQDIIDFLRDGRGARGNTSQGEGSLL